MKLHKDLGYPKEVLDFEYSMEAFCRGLIIDKTKGNIIKIDRHKYVRKVFHGKQELDSAEKKTIYGSHVVSFTESNYVNIDTLFLLIDALLFTSLVDLSDKNPNLIQKSYEEIYKDVRASVDLCHKDGVIKDAVIKNPSKHIIYDAGMVPMLQRLKQSGKKVFLLTNSMWEYTNVVMDYLVHEGGEHKDIEWESLFDVVIVGASKPGFLTNEYLSLFKVEKTGLLKNIEDKDSLTLESIEADGNRVFQGGHWQDLHKIMQITSGEKVLYVGDHVYTDILRSKRSLGWRTCLIIPELDRELEVYKKELTLGVEVMNMRRLQDDLDEYLDLLQKRIAMGDETEFVDQLSEARNKADELKITLKNLADLYDSKFNPTWGQLFKAGQSQSRFSKQVSDYACLYTSRASNLGTVSPNRSFRPVQDFVPHDQVLFDSENYNDAILKQ
eukprot:CAMPEP_0119034716 /NCGR_PEP_ID=MMETSP1177-20130426/1734_1 /TAXON_ID=2985 /ORGANISM="Ochromonas sp, Strain CCMP1899" /LENGTH=440 /DNA_ID=CAMNT_0006992373 /DNA_START=349 /DNA_END=1671 /DNA_ORIENTATION=+